jgi:hypothetical protein
LRKDLFCGRSPWEVAQKVESVTSAAKQFAEKLGFVSGYRFSDTASPSKSIAPLGADRRISSFPANCKAADENKVVIAALKRCATQKTRFVPQPVRTGLGLSLGTRVPVTNYVVERTHLGQ